VVRQGREVAAMNNTNATNRIFCPVIALGALLAVSLGASAEPLKVPPGTPVELELQHHVTAGYIEPGSPIYFRIARDVQVEGRTVIAAGTLAQGRMIDAQERGRIGRSGTMSLGVKQIRAVDGSWVAVDADLSKQGRSRAGATVGWVVFWGLPGLITKGVNPYLERGSIIDGSVMAEATVDPDKAPSPEPAPDPSDARPFAITAHAFEKAKDPELKFDIERDKPLHTITFTVEPPADVVDPAAFMQGIELVSVDGKPVPVNVRPTATTATTMTFDGWSVVQFCHDGATRLGFHARTADGVEYAGERELLIKVLKKVPKDKKST
jgi:hypothetical protein